GSARRAQAGETAFGKTCGRRQGRYRESAGKACRKDGRKDSRQGGEGSDQGGKGSDQGGEGSDQGGEGSDQNRRQGWSREVPQPDTGTGHHPAPAQEILIAARLPLKPAPVGRMFDNGSCCEIMS
ncbi:MAG TPA: hypothetical protein PLH21_01395, partial [Chiayiivirga sp.]|nr:hypothetical protein [Chiayiivirga sp.]